MNIRIDAPWLVLCLLICAALAGCETLQDLTSTKPTAKVTDARLRDLAIEGAGLDFDVDVSNPYGVPLPLVDLSYDVGSQGRSLVSGSSALSGTIPANGSRTVTLPADLRFADVLQTLSGVRPGEVIPYELGATLSVDAPGIGPIGLPLKKTGELPVPAVPKVEVAGIDWGDISLNEATATLRMRVENPNQFDLDLRKLDYGLSLGGTPVARTAVRERASIGSGQTGEIAIPISIRPSDMGLAALGMLRGDGAPYAIDGIMKVGTPFGPLDMPFAGSGETPFGRK